MQISLSQTSLKRALLGQGARFSTAQYIKYFHSILFCYLVVLSYYLQNYFSHLDLECKQQH